MLGRESPAKVIWRAGAGSRTVTGMMDEERVRLKTGFGRSGWAQMGRGLRAWPALGFEKTSLDHLFIIWQPNTFGKHTRIGGFMAVHLQSF
jgi:hypothetical protein